MKGTMITIPPTGSLDDNRGVVLALDARLEDHDARLSIRELTATPDVGVMQREVGGYIQLVPGFVETNAGGKWRNCIAYCNEEGKLNGLPVNRRATLLWEGAVKRAGGSLRASDNSFAEWLVGPVIILFGDDEFMGAL